MASLVPPVGRTTVWTPNGWEDVRKLPEPMTEAERYRLRMAMARPTFQSRTFRLLLAAGLTSIKD